MRHTKPVTLSLSVLATLAAHAQSVSHTIIAKSGDTFPSLPPNSSLTGLFDAAVLNNSGDCLFWARLQGEHITSANNAAFFVGLPGAPALLARKGNPAPGLRPGSTLNFDYFPWTPVLTDSGKVIFNSFIANLGGDPAEDNATFSAIPGSITPIAFSGAFAPNTWDHYFKTVNYPNANDIGEAAFKARIVPLGDPGSYREGIYVGQPGRYRAALTTDEPAPLLSNVLVNTISTDPAIDRSGRVLFPVTLRGDSVTYFNSQALYFGLPDQLSLVFRSGVTQVPGMPAGAVWFPIENAVLNDHGAVAFTGFARSPDVSAGQDQGIWAGSPGSLQLLAREGSTAAGLPDGWTLGSAAISNAPFSGPTIDNSGVVYFGAPASLALEPESGAGPWLFSTDSHSLQGPRLLLGGMRQPINVGTGAFVTSAELIASNDSGMVLSYAILAGHRITDSNNRGLVISHVSGWNIFVARTGELFEVAPDDFRHITDIHIEMFQGPGQGGPAGGHDGRPRVLNNAGQITFVADFDDGGSAVVLAQVYCPADFNHDASTDLFDYLDFVSAFSVADPAADFNFDGLVDFFDYLDFVRVLSEGC